MTDTTEQKTTHDFQAEVAQVLRLVINSLYSHKEIFLRELISNASDALDKLRFRSVTEPGLVRDGETLKIQLIPDKAAGTLTVSDNGVGMTRDELVRDLGTIARSGSREFLEKLEEAQKGDLNVIGQFGVGFYSAWLVATRVEVISRAAGQDAAWRWSSDASHGFTVEPAERVDRGTSVVLHLGPEHREFAEPGRLTEVVQRYSDYLAWPIELLQEREEGEGADRRTVSEFRPINRGTALWQRSPSEVTDEQYEEFYKHLTHDWEGPLAWRHFKVEGTQEFRGLVFLPKRAPFDLFLPDSKHGVRLYVRRVFIMEDCDELLPRWLRFVRGVIDSEDLPLNVSRELLQDSSLVRVIRKQVVKQTLDLMEQLSKDRPEDYGAFWLAFGATLKEGLHFEPEHRDRLLGLVRYESSASDGLTSLGDYKARMPEGQKAIYYALGESRAHLEASPHLEALKSRGFEVLYMTDPVDQWAASSLTEFDGLAFISASSESLELERPSTDGDASERDGEDALRALRDRMRIHLQDRVQEVRVSNRLTDSPVCLVVPEGGLQPHIERMLRAANQSVPVMKRILEINPTHPLMKDLERLVAEEKPLEQVNTWIDLLYEQALLVEGSPIEDPARFSRQMTALLEETAHRYIEGS